MSVFPTRILLATDGSEDAARATEAATDLANRSGSELHVVHVWRDVPSAYAHAFVRRELRRQGQEILDAQAGRIQESGGTVARAYLREGRTTDEVLRLAEETGAGLLVVGRRGLGTVQRILMGSHSEEIVHRARLPVLVVRSKGSAWPPQLVIVGEDLSEDAASAGEFAASIGRLYGLRLILIHAHPDLPEIPPGETRDAAASELGDLRERKMKRMEGRADELEKVLGSRPETVVSDGYPATVILEATKGTPSPIIAVGSHGISGARRTRLGSVSAKIVTAAPGPVLVCPHSRET
jgi:nucleotide-binding universal stress UspA family protein